MPGFWDRFGAATQRNMETSGAEFLRQMALKKQQEMADERARKQAALQLFVNAKTGDEASAAAQGAGDLLPGDVVKARVKQLHVPTVADKIRRGAKNTGASPSVLDILSGNNARFKPTVDAVPEAAAGPMTEAEPAGMFGQHADLVEQYGQDVVDEAMPLAQDALQEEQMVAAAKQYEQEQKRIDSLLKVANVLQPWERRAFLKASGVNLPGGETPEEEVPPIKEGETVYKDQAGRLRWMPGAVPDKADELVFPDQLSDAQVNRANTLRSDFTAENKDYYKVRDAFSKIEAAAQQPTAAGDLALIFNYMRLLDPGSTVREGEFATAQDAAGVPDRVRNMWNRMLLGTRLSAGQRKDFVNRAKMMFDSQQALYERSRKKYEDIADLFSVPHTAVGLDDKGIPDIDWAEEAKKYRVLNMDPDDLDELFKLEQKGAANNWNLDGKEYERYNELKAVYDRSWSDAPN